MWQLRYVGNTNTWSISYDHGRLWTHSALKMSKMRKRRSDVPKALANIQWQYNGKQNWIHKIKKRVKYLQSMYYRSREKNRHVYVLHQANRSNGKRSLRIIKNLYQCYICWESLWNLYARKVKLIRILVRFQINNLAEQINQFSGALDESNEKLRRTVKRYAKHSVSLQTIKWSWKLCGGHRSWSQLDESGKGIL